MSYSVLSCPAGEPAKAVSKEACQRQLGCLSPICNITSPCQAPVSLNLPHGLSSPMPVLSTVGLMTESMTICQATLSLDKPLLHEAD